MPRGVGRPGFSKKSDPTGHGFARCGNQLSQQAVQDSTARQSSLQPKVVENNLVCVSGDKLDARKPGRVPKTNL